MDDETLKKYAYVSISSYRAKAVKALREHDKTPSVIARDSGIRINHISKVLRELKESDIAVCLNEEERKNRIYRLTSMGREIADNLKDYD